MKARTKRSIADAIVTAALVAFAVLEISRLHGLRLWLAFGGYLVAIVALSYLNDDIVRAKVHQEAER